MKLRFLILALAAAAAVLALPPQAFAAQGVTRAPSILRAGPGTEYPTVARVADDQPLEIFGCLARGSWCDVEAGNERGWMAGSRIDFLRDGRRTQLSGNFVNFGLSILSFGRADYWRRYYGDRPWVNDRRPPPQMLAPHPPGPSPRVEATPPLMHRAQKPCPPPAWLHGSTNCHAMPNASAKHMLPQGDPGRRLIVPNAIQMK